MVNTDGISIALIRTSTILGINFKRLNFYLEDTLMKSSNPANLEYQDNIQLSSRIERRRTLRYSPLTIVTVSFYNNGNLYHGKINDITKSGMGIQIAQSADGQQNKTPGLEIRQTIECYILNRYGRSKCRGIIQWMGRQNQKLSWGISFIELSKYMKDPFRLLINEVCQERLTLPVTGMAIY